MLRRLAIVAAALAGFIPVGATSAALPETVAPVSAAKTCSAGWKHAVIGGEHKCLRAGQYCARRYDAQYHGYGYHCHKQDSSGRYRLTR